MEELLPFERIQRKVSVKVEAETSRDYGEDPNNRRIERLIDYGVINLNKQSGPTSHQVSDYVQKILHIEKSGHSGTLDPRVTGVLPIALSKGTRVVQTLLTAGKEYVCLMYLHDSVQQSKIHKSVDKLVGRIKQLPPRRSAIKRQERFRNVYYLNTLEIDGKFVLFKVGCEAGTYIRKLCLHPQTEILSNRGIVTILDFYSNPSKVYSFDGRKIREEESSETQRIPSPSKLIKITMSSGINFIVTPDHKMLQSSVEGYKMVEAGKLKEGTYLVKSLAVPNITKNYVVSDLLDDRFLIHQPEIKQACKKAFIKKYGSIREMYRKLKLDRKPFLSNSKNDITIRHLKLAGVYNKVKNKIKIFKTEKGTIIRLNKLNAELFYLLGLIASDGNNTKEKNTIRHTRLKFHNKNEVLIDKFLGGYSKLFPHVNISKKRVNKGIFQLDTSNSLFATLASSLGIKSPQNKSDILPILYSKPEFVKAFLRGCFDGDGTSYFKKKQKTGYYTDIRFLSINYISAKRLHQMLLRLGIPNKIFKRGKMNIISLESLAAKHKFIKEIGSNHPNKKKILNKISNLKNNDEIENHYHIGLHYKEYIKKNKKILFKNVRTVHKILKWNKPITRRLYKKCSKITKLPPLDSFIIEKITSIGYVKGYGYVYDMTVPETHNFLIETGFVSSNCHDWGQYLGVGAHMVQLVRTKAGPFNDNSWVSLHDLKDAYEVWKDSGDEKLLRQVILPLESAVSHLPKVWVFDTTVDSLCHGATLSVPGVSKVHSEIDEDDMVAVFTLKGELVCLGKALMTSEDIMSNEKGLAVRTSKVFMEPNIYPKYVKEQ